MRPLQVQPILAKASNVNTTSSPIDFRQIVCFSVQALAAAGSCAGTFQIQVNNTPAVNADFTKLYNPPTASWVNLGSPLTFAQASAASAQLIPKADSSYVAMRVIFTDTSGGANTSLITVSIAALGL